LFSRPPRSQIVLPNEIDFGILPVANKIVSRLIYIQNSGQKNEKYYIHLREKTFLNIPKLNGTANAADTAEITVRFHYFVNSLGIDRDYTSILAERDFEVRTLADKNIFRFTFHSHKEAYITVRGTVVEPRLVLTELHDRTNATLQCQSITSTAEIIVYTQAVPVELYICKDFVSGTNEDKQVDRYTKTVCALSRAREPLDLWYDVCAVGASHSQKVRLINGSSELPITFILPKIAHFVSEPATGLIQPMQTVSITITFVPKQQGSFSTKQRVLVMEKGASRQKIKERVIFEDFVTLRGEAVVQTRKPTAKFNYGITPDVANETGRCADAVKFDSINSCPRMAIINASTLRTRLAKFCSNLSGSELAAFRDSFIAFPNDRTASIRPVDKEVPYRTIFTHVLRYTYLDHDYEYGPEELRRLQLARGVQDRRIRQRSIRRLRQARDRLLEDRLSEPDDGIIPLTAPRVLKPLPWTSADQCKVSPKVIDFRQICPHSVVSAEFKIDNQLSQTVLVRFVPEGTELDKSASLSTEVRPFSATTLTVLYSKAELGDFQSNVTIHLNGSLAGNCVLCAKVVPLTLSLYPTHLSLSAKDTSLADPVQPGLRGYVRLTNALNAPAVFRWVPVFNEEGSTFFQIRPKNGEFVLSKSLKVFKKVQTHEYSSVHLYTSAKAKSEQVPTESQQIPDTLLRMLMNTYLTKSTSRSSNMVMVSIFGGLRFK
uniref:Hydrocephalus-inducing protein n=1 Tax=Schistocephalus solidus TaxID=70667 RepID=A0A183TCP3_SCHSO